MIPKLAYILFAVSACAALANALNAGGLGEIVVADLTTKETPEAAKESKTTAANTKDTTTANTKDTTTANTKDTKTKADSETTTNSAAETEKPTSVSYNQYGFTGSQSVWMATTLKASKSGDSSSASSSKPTSSHTKSSSGSTVGFEKGFVTFLVLVVGVGCVIHGL